MEGGGMLGTASGMNGIGSMGGADTGGMLAGAGGLDANTLPGYDIMYGLTRVQRLDGEPLQVDDPLNAYTKLEHPKTDTVTDQPNSDKLKIILLAFHEFYSHFQHLPRSANRLTKQQPPHSWRVAILPLIGYGSLYNEYKFEQSWDSPDIFASPLTRLQGRRRSAVRPIGPKLEGQS